MATISALTAREIQDSRGTPTIEVEIETANAKAVASVPSGASVGAHEAHELRDEDGRGVLTALAQVNTEVASALVDTDFTQASLDARLCALDGTPNKGRLGGNAILAVSIAFARAAAEERGVPLHAYLGELGGNQTLSLPEPLFNILNGGKHARHGIDIQECMIAPIGIAHMRDKVEAAKACTAALHALLEEKGLSAPMGDEGGFAPTLSSNEEALGLLVAAIEKAGYTTDNIRIALDVAATSLYKEGKYVFQDGEMSRDEMIRWYASLAEKYPIISIEDGFAEDDFDAFTLLTGELGRKISIVGDDLTVTNTARITQAVERNAANACIIKPNQIGTVSEAIEAVQTARGAGWKIFASHRSGETLDTFIVDFAAGLSCEYLKAGAPTREERLVKYNRLIEIEETV